MIVTEQEYKSMFKEIDGMTFIPKRNLIVEENEVDGEKVKVFKYEILKTADELYQEYIENKNNPPKKEPSEVEILQKQLLETQALVAELRYKTILKENGGI